MFDEKCLNLSEITMIWFPDVLGANSSLKSRRMNSADFHLDANDLFLCEGLHADVLLASADKLRKCPRCRDIFTKAFHLPETWWLQHYQNSNGYFGCAEEKVANSSLRLNTWAFFKVKQLNENLQYQWFDFNILTRWDASTQQSMTVLFDVQPVIANRLIESLNPVKSNLITEPLGIYAKLMDELACLQDTAVWTIRDHVRAIELGKWSTGKSEPDYRRLHDLARHATHVTEMVDVGVHVMESVVAQHQLWEAKVGDNDAWKDVHTRLLAFKQLLGSLRCRSVSNQQRLQNEIQLAFNLVAQEASKASIAINQAMRVDSAPTKTVSILTLIVLAPTLLCAMFSMSFFNYDAQAGWTVSDQFWLYWVLAIPATIGAAIIYFWQSILAVLKSVREARSRKYVNFS